MVLLKVPVWFIQAGSDTNFHVVGVFTDRIAAKTHWKKLEAADPGYYTLSGRMYTNRPLKQAVGYDSIKKKEIYI
jgi:hypothetical protein